MKTRKILALLLVAAMMLSFSSIVAMADGPSVAQIGEQTYSSLEEAITAAVDGDTITIIDDFAISDTKTASTDRIVVEKSITIDFGTYTMSVPGSLEPTGNWAGLFVQGEGVNVVLNGTTGGINCLDNGEGVPGTYAINIKDGASLTINGGNYHGGGTAINLNVGSVTINGGNYSITDYTEAAYSGYKYVLNCIDSSYAAGTAIMSVKGGTFANFDPSNCLAEGANTNFVAEGYEAVDNGDGTWTVSSIKVAEVNGVKYETLEAAIAAAEAGDTVKLIADIDYSTTYTERNARDEGRAHIVDLKDLTLDLNGHTISTINASVTFGGKGATIKNGTFDLVKKNTDGSFKEGSYAIIIDNAVIDGYTAADKVTLTDLVCVGGVNVCAATVELNNVTAETTPTKFYAIWAEQYATVTVNSGTYTDAQTKGKGVFAIGTGAEGGAVIKVMGGTFNASNKVLSSGLTASLVICGGTFTKDPSAYVAEGYEVVDNGNGTWTVKSSYDAEINGTKYATLKAAIAAAEAGDVVRILRDVDVTSYPKVATYYNLTINKSITLDGCGYSVKANSRGIAINQGGTETVDVTIKNLTVNNASSAGRAISTRGKIGTVTLDNVKMNCTGTGNTQGFTVGGNQATAQTVNIINGSSIYAGNSGYCVITFNPVNLTVDGSTLDGWASLYAKGIDGSAGSKDSVFTVTNSTLISDNQNAGNSNAFSLIKIEDDGVTVNLGEGNDVTIKGTNNLQSIVATEAFGTADHTPKGIIEDCVVNIDGGNFTMTGSAPFAIVSGSDYTTLNVTGGNFTLPEEQPFVTYNGIVNITGGTYSADPSVFVAEGYEAVEADGLYTVGAVQTTEVAPAAEADDGFDATYTATKKVVDDEGHVLSETANVKFNIVANIVAEDNVVSSDVAVEKVDMPSVIENIMDTVDDQDNVTVKLAINKDDIDETANTVTYNVYPVAQVFDGETQLLGTKEISNDDLKDGATFEIILPIPNALKDLADRVKVTHISEDPNYPDEVASYAIEGTEDNYYITVVVTHFSIFDITADAETGSAEWYATLSLKDSIDVNVYVNSLTVNPELYELEYTFKGVTTRTALTSAESNRITVAECAAAAMCDEIVLKLFCNGTQIGNTVNYSVEQYCKNMIDANENASLVALCKAALEYGYYAQLHFGYNTDKVPAEAYRAGTSQTAEPEGISTDVTADYRDVAYAASATLSLESKTQLNVYFAPFDGYQDPAKFTVTAATLTRTLDTEVAVSSGNALGVIVKGIAAKDLNENITVTITNNVTEKTGTIMYSPMTFVARMWDKETTGPVCRALYGYYQAAANYFG